MGRFEKGKVYLPPKKCLPMKYFTRGLGAVRLIRCWGINDEPGPEVGGPLVMSQEEGASMDVMGREDSERAVIIEGKGSRRVPEKEKPGWVSGVGKGVARGGLKLK